MSNVLFSPDVRKYFVNLVKILHEKEYFGSLESAKKYVQDLYDDIETNLPLRSKKVAPPHFDCYGNGMYYVTFTKNKHTQYYVFFRKYLVNEIEIYQVRYIGNNHTVAQHL
jgi:hypothetical protein